MTTGEVWICFSRISSELIGLTYSFEVGDKVIITETYCFDTYNCNGKTYRYAYRVWFKKIKNEKVEYGKVYWLMDFIFLKHFERILLKK